MVLDRAGVGRAGEEVEEGDSEEEDEEEEDDEDEDEDEDEEDAGSEDLVCIFAAKCLDGSEGYRMPKKASDGSRAVNPPHPPTNFCKSRPNLANPVNPPKLVLLLCPEKQHLLRKVKQSIPSYPRRRDPAEGPRPRKITDRLRRHWRLSGWKGL